ncbi:prolactin-3C1-like [Arvicanthis niloticus]|uniref:prolactin-3C1-like n=1 Tax=Arvicanthis niloticus TaxID=61156 RepID=UPI0014864F10|nr:prolactin-3C1-like [Arvicanthis niloticus]
MQLSLTQASTWKCTLLLMSCIILWVYVTATPHDQMSNEELYDNLFYWSHRTLGVARKMYKILDSTLTERMCFKNKNNNTCQTTSNYTITNNEDLLKFIINVSNAWIYPLKILAPAVLTHLDAYDGMLGRAVEVNYGNKQVLKGAKILLSRIQPGIEENYYPNWIDLKELRSSNERTHLLAFCKLFYCLRKDTKKIVCYLRALRHGVIKNKC